MSSQQGETVLIISPRPFSCKDHDWVKGQFDKRCSKRSRVCRKKPLLVKRDFPSQPMASCWKVYWNWHNPDQFSTQTLAIKMLQRSSQNAILTGKVPTFSLLVSGIEKTLALLLVEICTKAKHISAPESLQPSELHTVENFSFKAFSRLAQLYFLKIPL